MAKRFRLAYLTAALASISCGAGEPGDAALAAEELTGNGLSATLSPNSDWGSGYCQNVTVTNVGTTQITQWQVQVDLGGSVYSSGWSATFSTSGGRLIAAPLDWNKTLAPGAGTTIGFCASGSGRPTVAAVSANGSGGGTGGSTGTGGTATGGTATGGTATGGTATGGTATGGTATGGTTGSTPYSGTPAALPGTLQAESFDNGGEGVAFHDADATNSGGAYRTTGVDLESTTDSGGGYNIGWTAAGEWLNYTVNVATAGTYTLEARVASNGNGGNFHVEFGGANKTGAMTVPNTGGWQTYQTLSKTVTLAAGRQVMRLVTDSTGSSGYVGNFNWIRLTAGDGGTGGTGGSGGSPGDAVKSAGCGKATTLSGQVTRTLSVGGTTRSYILRLPDNYDRNHPYRLLTSIHWLNGTAAAVAGGSAGTSYQYYGLWKLAGGSTIFVAPQGINNAWPNSGGGDVAFIKALIAELANTLCIDQSRIFSEGFSMGGSMSYALACAMPDTFRGVAVHSGGPMSGCDRTNRKPVAYFMTHGTRDSVCTYPGYGVPQINDFAQLNGCRAMDIPNTLKPTDSTGRTPVCGDFQGCSAGHPARACIFMGDHTPSPGGEATTWVPAETWKFITQF